MADYSANTAQMQTTEDPGEVGTESLASSLQGELTRLRFALLETKQAIEPALNQWYESPTVTALTLDVDNSILLASASVVASSATAVYGANTVTDGDPWDLSNVTVGMAIEADSSYGIVTVVNDGTDTLTVASWVGGTPANSSVATVRKTPSITIGSGDGQDSEADFVIDKGTGNAKLRLQVNNAAANAWDIVNDNSDSDKFKLLYNNSLVFEVGTDGDITTIGALTTIGDITTSVPSTGTAACQLTAEGTGDAELRLRVNDSASNEWIIRNDNSVSDQLRFIYNGEIAFTLSTGTEQINMVPSNIAAGTTPTPNGLYPNTLVKAWGHTITTLQDGVNLTLTSGGTGIFDYTFKTAMANNDYAVIASLVASSGNSTAHIVSQSPTAFQVRTFIGATLTNLAHNVIVVGEQ